MSLGSDLSGALAPENELGRGGGAGEVAEWLSLVNPLGGVEAPGALAPASTLTPTVAVEVGALIERWVRRVALGGDQRRGAVRLDIGQGRFSGAELVIVAESGRVSVELSLPPAVAVDDLSERLRSRLEGLGYEADVLVR